MGDASDMSDLERFMRSPEGADVLNSIRRRMENRRIVSVSFENAIWAISASILLDDGSDVDVLLPELTVETVQEDFADVLKREYLRDFPERCSNR